MPFSSRILVGLTGFVVLTTTHCSASLNSFVFTVSNTISAENPSATVTLWGAFDPKLYALHRTTTDVIARPDPGSFHDPFMLIDYPWCRAGQLAPDGDRVSDIFALQLQFIGGFFADTSNPIAIWTATWSTTDFTPREVALWTESSEYWVFVNGAGEAHNFYGVDFAEGLGAITVVPAPNGALAFAAAVGLAARRHRAGHSVPIPMPQTP